MLKKSERTENVGWIQKVLIFPSACLVQRIELFYSILLIGKKILFKKDYFMKINTK